MRAPWEQGEWDARRSDPPSAIPMPPPTPSVLRSDPPSQVIRLSAPQVISDRPKAVDRVEFSAPAQKWSSAPPPANNFTAPSFAPATNTFSQASVSSEDSQHDFFAAQQKSKPRNYALMGGVAVAGLVGLVLIWALFFRSNAVSTPIAVAPAETAASVKPPEENEAAEAVAVAPIPQIPRHRLSVSANQGAHVSIDGSEVTAFDNVELDDGTHTVEISADGFTSETRRVNLTRDTALTVNLRASPTVAATRNAPARNHRHARPARRRPASSIRRSGFVSRNPYR